MDEFGGVSPREIGVAVIRPSFFESKGWRRLLAIYLHAWTHLPLLGGYADKARRLLPFHVLVLSCPICSWSRRLEEK